MSNEIKEKEEYEKYARDHRKELDAQEVKLGDVVTVLVGQFAGEKGVIVGISACQNDYSGPYYEVGMNCEVPEKYKCRKTLISPNNVIGGLSAHEIEVIGNCTPKQPSMEIKVGDKVRVSKDAPKMYLRGFDHIFTGVESVVTEVEDDNAVIIFNTGHINSQITIPTKYLVKVDAEDEKPKIKLGDRVRVKGNLHEPFCLDADLHLEITNIPPHAISQKEWKVIGVEIRRDCAGHIYALNHDDSFIYNIPEDCVELVEPTEQTEAEEEGSIPRMQAELDELRKAELDRVLHSEKPTFEVTIDNVAMNWQRYEADLAKEVAVKVANKYNDQKEAAEYAVSVAKAVVEGLKRE